MCDITVPQIPNPKAIPTSSQALPSKAAVSPPVTNVSGEPYKSRPEAGKGKKKGGEGEGKGKKKAGSSSGGETNTTVDVSRLDFKIGCILSVERHPDADSLYVEQSRCS